MWGNAAEELDAAVDHAPLHLRAEQLDLGGPLDRERSADELHRRLVGERLGGVGLGLARGELEAGVLERGDRGAERLALLDVLDGHADRRLRGRDADDGDAEALLGEVVDHLAEALALADEEVLGGHPRIVEEELGGVLGVHADLLEVAAPLEARACRPR